MLSRMIHLIDVLFLRETMKFLARILPGNNKYALQNELVNCLAEILQQ